jgi:Fe-S-cluster containining protein
LTCRVGRWDFSLDLTDSYVKILFIQIKTWQTSYLPNLFTSSTQIANRLLINFNQQKLTSFKEQLKSNCELILKNSDVKKANILVEKRMYFLVDHQCSIYDIRPANCRQFHSTDIEICLIHKQPLSSKVADPANQDLKQVLHAAIAGFEDAFTQLNIDTKRCVFLPSLLNLLEKFKPQRKLFNKEPSLFKLFINSSIF